MAQNKKRAKKILYNNNLEEIKNDLEEARQREKLQSNRIERQQQEIEQQKIKILQLEKAIKEKMNFDDFIHDLFENDKVQDVLLDILHQRGLGKKLLEISSN